jgi:hypothetical protein
MISDKKRCLIMRSTEIFNNSILQKQQNIFGEAIEIIEFIFDAKERSIEI